VAPVLRPVEGLAGADKERPLILAPHATMPPMFKAPIISAVLLALLFTAPFSPVVRKAEGDQVSHLILAAQMWERGELLSPHWLYQALVILVHIVVPWISWHGAALLVMGVSYAGLGLVVGTSLQAVLGRPTSVPIAVLLVVLTVATVVAAPVSLFTWPFGDAYFGYLNVDGYHNPTHILLRPLAALILVLAVRVFTLGRGRWDVPILAFTTMLAALAKPSLHIALLPAVTLLAGAYLLLRKPLRIGLLVSGIIGPSILLLIPQFLVYFQASLPTTTVTTTALEARSQIIFAPLLVMGSASGALGPKFVLSILFPLVVLVCYRRRVVHGRCRSRSGRTPDRSHGGEPRPNAGTAPPSSSRSRDTSDCLWRP
jgi:hypothetical protein